MVILRKNDAILRKCRERAYVNKKIQFCQMLLLTEKPRLFIIKLYENVEGYP